MKRWRWAWMAWATLLGLPLVAQEAPAYWIAGRYDSSHVVIVFDAVHYGLKPPAGAKDLPAAVAPDLYRLGEFFSVPAALAARYQVQSRGERFAPGDVYDLLLGNARGYYETLTVTIVQCVGWQFDEGVGNDSYLGAVAAVKPGRFGNGLMEAPGELFVVRRHVPGEKVQSRRQAPGIMATPPQFAVETAIGRLLERWLPTELRRPGGVAATMAAPLYAALEAGRGKLRFDVQGVRLASGDIRYYVRAEWDLPPGLVPRHRVGLAMGAWLAPSPTLHIVSSSIIYTNEDDTGIADNLVPALRNAVDLGDGATGVILMTQGGDGFGVALCAYSDKPPLRVLSSFSAGE